MLINNIYRNLIKRINNIPSTVINDDAESVSSTYSSEKINELIEDVDLSGLLPKSGGTMTGSLRLGGVLLVTTLDVEWEGQNVIRMDANAEEVSLNLGDGTALSGALVVITALDVTNNISISGSGGCFDNEISSPVSLTTVGDNIILFSDESAGWIFIKQYIQ